MCTNLNLTKGWKTYEKTIKEQPRYDTYGNTRGALTFNDCYSGIQNSIISNLKKINSDDYEKLIFLLNDFSVMELKVIDIYDLLTYKLTNYQ